MTSSLDILFHHKVLQGILLLYVGSKHRFTKFTKFSAILWYPIISKYNSSGYRIYLDNLYIHIYNI